jgi:hypothetical protein
MILPKGKEGVSNGYFKDYPSLTEKRRKNRWHMHVLIKLKTLRHI